MQTEQQFYSFYIKKIKARKMDDFLSIVNHDLPNNQKNMNLMQLQAHRELEEKKQFTQNKIARLLLHPMAMKSKSSELMFLNGMIAVGNLSILWEMEYHLCLLLYFGFWDDLEQLQHLWENNVSVKYRKALDSKAKLDSGEINAISVILGTLNGRTHEFDVNVKQLSGLYGVTDVLLQRVVRGEVRAMILTRHLFFAEGLLKKFCAGCSHELNMMVF